MAQKRQGETGRSARKTAGRRIPTTGVVGKLIIMAAVVAAVVFGVAIFFKVSSIEVHHNVLYSAEQIIEASEIEQGDNLLTLNKAIAAGKIQARLPYVERVSIGRTMPDTVVIDVTESTATFAVATDVNTVWLISSTGKALERLDPETPKAESADASVEELLSAQEAEQAPQPEEPAPSEEERLSENAAKRSGEAEAENETEAENEAEAEENAALSAEEQQLSELAAKRSGQTGQEPEASAPSDESLQALAERRIAQEAAAAAAEEEAKASRLTDAASIIGVTIHNPTAGQQVTAVNQSALDAALAVLEQFRGTGLLAHVRSVNVEKEFDIVVQYDDQYEIRLGGTDNLPYKVQYLQAILDRLSEYQAGTIDLTFTQEDVARFHPKQ